MKLLLAVLASLILAPAASASYNVTTLGEHWPTTVTVYNQGIAAECSDPTKVSDWTRCIVVYDRTGFGRASYFDGPLKTALAHLNEGSWPRWFYFVPRYRDVRFNVDTQAGILQAYQRKFFGAIVIGYGSNFEVNYSYGELDGDPEMGDLPDYYAADQNIERTGLCIIGVSDRGRETTEHELGHCLGLTHWPLDPNAPPWQGDICLDEWPGGVSVMCALGEGRMGASDYASMRYLYDHIDDLFGSG